MKKTPSSSAKGEVRIIAGLWRGRKLPVLNAEGLRPTGDRMKEMLFNWLMAEIPQSCCLDAFAGSGSLGFEALSRQAKTVIFLEQNKAVANQLKKNLQTLKVPAEKAQVHQQNTLDFLAQDPQQTRFDVVFLDPPFHFGLAQQAVNLLHTQNWLAENALIYVETEKAAHLQVPNNWQLLKEKVSGAVSARLYQKN